MDEQTTKLLNKTFTLAAILVVGVLVFFVGQLGFQSKTLELQNADQITVSGAGKIYAKPDVATITLGLKTDGQTVKDITQTNTTIMNKILKELKDLGISDKDVQTVQYYVAPQYNWTEKGGTVPNGYTVEQDVQVKIRDFDKIGDVLSIAANHGANTISGLQFTIDNPEQFKDQARAKAIAQAKANAQNLAKESGLKLGKLINVYESSSPYPVMYNSAKAVGGGVMESAPVPTVQPGQQEIDITINLTYQVK